MCPQDAGAIRACLTWIKMDADRDEAVQGKVVQEVLVAKITRGGRGIAVHDDDQRIVRLRCADLAGRCSPRDIRREVNACS